jgi:hypothetical protein
MILDAKSALWLLLASTALVATTPALADPPPLSEQRYLQGDQESVTAVDVQEFSRVAAGGPGFLVVWEERRSVLSGWVNMAGPLGGNGIDIYGMRLDALGNPLDPGPILICQDGQNQTKPQVAWNEAAGAWLVVWTSQRPDWYFFEDIVGARVSADGQLLDATPIPLRLENNSPANDYAQYPTVTSDGNQWVVAWVDILWQGGIGYPNVAAKRVDATGNVLDPAPVVLYQHPDNVFGPILPHLVWASDEYLLVWERAGYYYIYGKRLNAALQAIGPNSFLVTTSGYGPRVAANGTDFLVTSRFNRAHRVTHDGASLDPSGIVLSSPGGWDFRGPDVAWSGDAWFVVNSGGQAGHASIWLSRISTSGAILGTSAVQNTGHDQYNPAIASSGNSSAQVTWGERHVSLQYLENVRGSRVDAGGIGAPAEDVSAGLRRQSYVRFARNGADVLAVYVSQGGGSTRILAQRLGADGHPIDSEPVEIAGTAETLSFVPSAAWNGTYYLVTWAASGGIYGRRLDADAIPVDPAPVLLLTDNASAPAVGALGSTFLLAYTFTFSGDQNYLKGVRIDASDMSLIGSPVAIGPGFVIPSVQIQEFGGRWFVVYEAQGNHDVAASLVTGVFVEPNGTPAPGFPISTSYDDDHPGLAVAGDRALVTWSNQNDHPTSAIEGRLVNPDGTFRTAPFLVCDAPGEQLFTSAGFDGEQFVVAWTDFREVTGVEQMRGDIWAARVGLDGGVLDPGGFPLTNDPLPDDLPQVSGGAGRTVIAYCRMNGPAGPEVQRIGFRILGDVPTSVDLDGGPTAWSLGPVPFTDRITLSRGSSAGAGIAELGIEVFSIDGRLVFRGRMPANATRFVWDGHSDRGERAAPGTYYVRVSDGARSLFKSRIVRIR